MLLNFACPLIRSCITCISIYLKSCFDAQGCRHPLVVKFADTQKEKEMKKMQQVNANLLTSLGAINPLSPQYLAVSQSPYIAAMYVFRFYEQLNGAPVLVYDDNCMSLTYRT